MKNLKAIQCVALLSLVVSASADTDANLVGVLLSIVTLAVVNHKLKRYEL